MKASKKLLSKTLEFEYCITIKHTQLKVLIAKNGENSQQSWISTFGWKHISKFELYRYEKMSTDQPIGKQTLGKSNVLDSAH